MPDQQSTASDHRLTTADHQSTAAVYGGDQRSMVAVNDGRRWRTIVDHHRTTDQRWLIGRVGSWPGPGLGHGPHTSASLNVSALDKPHFKLENPLRRFIHESNPDDAGGGWTNERVTRVLRGNVANPRYCSKYEVQNLYKVQMAAGSQYQVTIPMVLEGGTCHPLIGGSTCKIPPPLTGGPSSLTGGPTPLTVGPASLTDVAAGQMRG
nr:hypothetical protein [Tanacetum cinerariifolium]